MVSLFAVFLDDSFVVMLVMVQIWGERAIWRALDLSGRQRGPVTMLKHRSWGATNRERGEGEQPPHHQVAP